MGLATQSPKKVTYIIWDISKMVSLEWICDFRNPQKTDLSFILLNQGDSEIEQFVRSKAYPYLRIPYAGKLDIPRAVFEIWKFLRREKTEIVHCHLFDACLTGLFASLFTRVKKRIHTRHYATYHHVYFPKAVKFDRFINRMSTDIIAISHLVQDVLKNKESVPSGKIHLVHHGFLVSEYADVSKERIDGFKNKYGIRDNELIIGVVARYTLLKGIQFIIPAFVQLLKDYPKAKLLIANSRGNDEDVLREMMRVIPSENLIEVQYERDMGALYKSLSLYVHVPIYDHIEAFGQTYVEALMAKIPSVFTLSGVAQEFIVHEHNALVVPFESADPIYSSMKRLIENNELRDKLIQNGFKDAVALFDLRKMIESLEEVYLS